MRVVFMGTPLFAVPALDALLATEEVVAVYTRPDSGSGRGRRVVDSAVKGRALETGVRLEQPLSLREPGVIEDLRTLAPDMIVVAAYGAILPPELVRMPRLGCINVHASLLPRWRGAAPVQRAILAGDDVTGISIMRMEEGLDTGPSCVQAEVTIDGMDATDLTSALATLGGVTLATALPIIASGDCEWNEQDASLATYATKVTAADVALDPALTVTDAWRRVRASGRSAPCRARIDGRRVTILEAAPADSPTATGAVLAVGGLVLGLADGALEVATLIPEGKSPMSAADWVRGARLATDAQWSTA